MTAVYPPVMHTPGHKSGGKEGLSVVKRVFDRDILKTTITDKSDYVVIEQLDKITGKTHKIILNPLEHDFITRLFKGIK